MELALFEAVAEACRGMVPESLGQLRLRPRPYGLKAWFGGAEPTKDHYEAQVVPAHLVPEADVLALEVGFHLEHRAVEENDEALERLMSVERRWRPALGPDVVAGPFLGRPDQWRRVSETWPDPDLGDPDLALDLAVRLTEYITVLEPLRSAKV